MSVQCVVLNNSSHYCSNKQNERDILSLHVFCTNSEKGCDWIGALNDVTNHLRNNSGCKFEKVRCPNGCRKTLERRYLVGHVEDDCPCRLTNCEYCGAAGEYRFIEGSHKQKCYKSSVPCPNKCEIKNVPSKHLKKHRKVCPLEIVQCEYHSVGCDTKMPHKDLTKHDEENGNKHLSLMKSALIDTQKKLSDTENRLALVERKLQVNYAEMLEAKFCNKIEAIVEGRISELGDSLNNKNQKLIDMLFGEWAVEMHTHAAKLSSCNQLLPVIIKFPDFVMNKEDNIDWDSDPFFTHHHGYKMKLNVVPAGYGPSEGRYLSVYLYIMNGPYDDQLRWRLKGRFQVTLLNQIWDGGYHSVSYWNHAERDQLRPFWYCEEFISHDSLYKINATCQFIKDDCLFFEVSEI